MKFWVSLIGLCVLYSGRAFGAQLDFVVSTAGDSRTIHTVMKSGPAEVKNGQVVETATLLSLTVDGASKAGPQYSVAKLGIIEKIYRLNDQGQLELSQIRGTLPVGGSFLVEKLEPMFHTMEVKPAGTILEEYCGTNVAKNASATQVCLASARASDAAIPF